MVTKGILTPEDALLSIKHGASGILISNHGGRQTDGVPATVFFNIEINFFLSTICI